MKRMLATLMVLSLSLALLAGCGSQGNNAASGSNAGANGETYTMRISHAVAETHPFWPLRRPWRRAPTAPSRWS